MWEYANRILADTLSPGVVPACLLLKNLYSIALFLRVAHNIHSASQIMGFTLIFCGYGCPLGAFNYLMDWFISRRGFGCNFMIIRLAAGLWLDTLFRWIEIIVGVVLSGVNRYRFVSGILNRWVEIWLWPADNVCMCYFLCVRLHLHSRRKIFWCPLAQRRTLCGRFPGILLEAKQLRLFSRRFQQVLQ